MGHQFKHALNLVFVLTVLLLSSGLISETLAQSTAFTYQGRLQDAGTNANGAYDFQFTLWDSLSGGVQQPQLSPVTVTKSGVAVVNGIFTVQLDFGANAFPGADRFLETNVRLAGSGSFTLLSPRQPLTSTPYAVRSLSSGNADVAATATNATQLGGVAANQYVVTTDTRLSDSRAPTSGSANYIQNVTAQQPGSNFNISGDGTSGGTLSANSINSATAYNIAGNKILSNSGSQNFFAGVGTGPTNTGANNAFFGYQAGFSNTTGSNNAFFGRLAGVSNTVANANSFFGTQAGILNTTGNNNSFFGRNAGVNNTVNSFNSYFGSLAGQNNDACCNSMFGFASGDNTTAGQENSFFGYNSGLSNDTGSRNTALGANADFGSASLSNATAIGYRASVSQNNSLVLGSIAGTNGASSSTNVGIGITAPTARLHVVGDTNLVGNLTVTGTVNATAQYNLNGIRAFSVSGGSNQYQNSNTFVGIDAGTFTTPSAGSAFGNFNSFLGTGAGHLNTGGENSFFGSYAGYNNTTGQGNSFFGDFAGNSNSTGTNNSFFGSGAGYSNTTASSNSFFGQQSGNSNTTGTSNSFFGTQAGLTNNTGNSNAFFGTQAGYYNTTGSGNAFIGAFAGTGNTTGGFNSFFGTSAGLSNTTGGNNAFFGGQAGQANVTGFSNAFFGTFAGFANATGGSNSFFGTSAGGRNTTGLNNTFIGNGADFNVSSPTGNNNTLLGGASRVSSGVSNASAIGASASVTQNNSLVLGSINGVNGATADTNVGIGTTAPSARLHVVGTTGLVGNVGIGTTAPVQQLHVVGNGLFTGSLGIGVTSPAVALEVQRNSTIASDWQTGQLRISGASDPNMQLSVGYDTSSNLGVIQAGQASVAFKNLSLNPSGGNVGIGTTSPSAKLHVNGVIRMDALGAPVGIFPLCWNANDQIASCSSSSLRYKADVYTFSRGLELIKKLRPISFNWRNGGMHDIGLAAEEVAAVEPLLTYRNKQGEVEGVRYNQLSAVFINAFKEQQAQIQQQQAQLNQQAEQIKQQEDQASKQRGALAAQQQELNALKKLVCRSHSRATVCR